jgi:predicted metal-binding membrane protein
LVPQLAVRAESRAARVRPDLVVWLGIIAGAWIAAYWLEVSGTAHLLHHHTIYHSGRILVGGLALVAIWQVMTAAMMLPGALPAVRRLAPVAAQVIFLGTYFAAWTVFAVVAFVGDMGLHALVHGWAAAAQNEYLIPGAVLGVAAVYQVSPWKGVGLDACRRPGRILARHQGGGTVDALRAGIDYSRQCLVSGWALMLIMFSAGVADLFWMVALALTMLAEKTLRSGDGVRYGMAGALALLAVGSLIGGSVFRA